MTARGRLTMALAVMSLAQGLQRGDPRMPGKDEPSIGGVPCVECSEPLRFEQGNDESAMCRNLHLNMLGPDGLPEVPPGSSPR